ncbi:hypothetical protein I79_011693 [Cricetulus griseus]|uniref:Uncharacterized protein n=1 Tax=Cricetulus griseus TaxID=10029 RepID=G3HLV0_CRIGR|nr:hypothetical protein I79_011693 [Cricetulus griseus]
MATILQCKGTERQDRVWMGARPTMSLLRFFFSFYFETGSHYVASTGLELTM